LFGKRPSDTPAFDEAWPGKLAFLFLLLFICCMGIIVPGPINRLLLSAVALLGGG
jgi:hypothetical protein